MREPKPSPTEYGAYEPPSNGPLRRFIRNSSLMLRVILAVLGLVVGASFSFIELPSFYGAAPIAQTPCASMSPSEQRVQGNWLEDIGATADPKITMSPDPEVSPGIALVAVVTEPTGTHFADLAIGWNAPHCTFQVLEFSAKNQHVPPAPGLQNGVSYDHKILARLNQQYIFQSPEGGSKAQEVDTTVTGKSMAATVVDPCFSTLPPSFTAAPAYGTSGMVTTVHMTCLPSGDSPSASRQ